MAKKGELTPKQILFVKEYLISKNATQAAKNAGYSQKTAREIGLENLEKPLIRAALQHQFQKVTEKLDISVEYVLSTIKDTVERCKQAKPVFDRKGDQELTELPNGNMAPAYKFDAANVLRGAELLGKHLKMFTERVDLSSEDGSMTPQAPVYKIVDE